MMHGREKSDPAVVAEKPKNEAAEEAAKETVEPRAGAKGNAMQPDTRRVQNRTSVAQGLDRIRQAAKREGVKFTSLLHHVSIALLSEAFHALKRDAAPGADGVTWAAYAADLESNLADLHLRVHKGGPYHPQPARRVYIPKPDGRQRPLAVAALEDKIVQRAVLEVLSAIYEEDFLGFSYGFRPGRSQHDALDALSTAITSRKVNYILDADIQSFFDTVNHDWLIRFLEHRIGDKRIIRLIGKWLKAGVLEDGLVSVSDMGTGQGSVISPLLSNVYLHYVIDLWAEQWRGQQARGDMVIVRYADDLVAGFEHEAEARRFLDAMRARLEAFALSLHPHKTRIIAFGRHAADEHDKGGPGKADTFDFLGFTFICAKSRRGGFLLKRKSRRDRVRAKLQQIKEALRSRMHRPIEETGKWLARVVRGFFNYHAVPTNSRTLVAFRNQVVKLWIAVLERQSNRAKITRELFAQLRDYLPAPRILHPWPEQRFAVKHPRWEPYAGKPHVRFCAGGAQ
ncbi:MAG: group II intron reverse transcriptase/maturase [Proteobacteria bacterium]|nr:group II intron reverse transcriptase/maturase [Pseudomonadota bacterium]